MSNDNDVSEWIYIASFFDWRVKMHGEYDPYLVGTIPGPPNWAQPLQERLERFLTSVGNLGRVYGPTPSSNQRQYKCQDADKIARLGRILNPYKTHQIVLPPHIEVNMDFVYAPLPPPLPLYTPLPSPTPPSSTPTSSTHRTELVGPPGTPHRFFEPWDPDQAMKDLVNRPD